MGFRVNIYVETSRKGPSRGPGAYYGKVEFMKKDGNPEYREVHGYSESTYENELALKGIVAALKLLTKSCCVRVFTPCEHVLHTVHNAWNVQWEKNGWMKSNGKYPNNLELWKELSKVSLKHAVSYTGEDHPYREKMKEELKSF